MVPGPNSVEDIHDDVSCWVWVYDHRSRTKVVDLRTMHSQLPMQKAFLQVDHHKVMTPLQRLKIKSFTRLNWNLNFFRRIQHIFIEPPRDLKPGAPAARIRNTQLHPGEAARKPVTLCRRSCDVFRFSDSRPKVPARGFQHHGSPVAKPENPDLVVYIIF